MIVRDEHDIIVQHPDMDGGDSSARMGISAIENENDRKKLFMFVTLFGLVRHPIQEQWDDSEKTSRDQLVQFCVSDSFATERAALSYARKWFINKDFLAPDVKLYLYRCAKLETPLMVKIFGNMFLWISLVWNTKIRPSEEMNQFSCICIKMGPIWCKRFIDWHPNISEAIMSYWSGWRDQKEIGEILLKELLRRANDISVSNK